MSARHIVLVGMPGAGKSTVGPLLAARIGLPFVELDGVVESQAAATVAQVFASEGEAGFRLRERAALAEALAGAPAVIATGGGVVTSPENRVRLADAITVWLRADLPTLAARTAGEGRPLLQGADRASVLARLADERRAWYAAADLHGLGDGPPAAVAASVADQLASAPSRIAVGGSRPYAVLIGEGLLEQVGSRIAAVSSPRRIALVTDAHVDALHGDRIASALTASGYQLERIVVEAGEARKSWAGLQTLTERFAAMRLDRGDLVVALGGGVVGDLAGFAAAVWMRGVDWVQMPTTLLAQVDSSVGGKTAIDVAAGKNLVGAFWPPRLVLADPQALATLPPRELRAGYAEAVKTGLLGDAALFARLEAVGQSAVAGDAAALKEIVARCVALKAEIVTQDERESVGGRRALLNLGHTFAHAIEVEAGYDGAILHGEAVAVGCCLALRFSARSGLCDAADAERGAEAFAAAGLPTRLADLPGSFGAARLVHRMGSDKKAAGDGLTLVLVRRIGEAVVVGGIDPASVESFLIDAGAAQG